MRIAKRKLPDVPACEQQQKDRKEVPQQKSPIHRQMREANRDGNQTGKNRQARMPGEETCVKGIERRVQDPLNSGDIDFCILDKRVIAMH